MLLNWSIVVFAHNEERRVADCLVAIANAVGNDVRSHLTLIVNGTSDDTLNKALDTLDSLRIPASVYVIPFGCKWNAMNAFVHEIRPPAQIYFFVDATAFVEPKLFLSFTRELEDKPNVVAVSGVPLSGRGAKRMRDTVTRIGGGLQQVFAVRREFLDDLTQRGRRIPVGLYRGDGMFSGYIMHETDGVIHRTPQRRIGCVVSTGWYTRSLSLFSIRDLKRWYNRLVRQARGRLENQAWNSIIWTEGFDALPRFGEELILEWLKTHCPRRERLPDRVFTSLALRRIRRWRPPNEADLRPIKVR